MTAAPPTLAVYAERVRSGPHGRYTEWVRIGVAWHNRDGSIAVRLDAFPLDGVMQIREEVSR